MAAEVVEVVEDENARTRPGGAPEEPGGGKSADPAAHDHEIVALFDVAEAIMFAGPTNPVRDLERAGMLTA